MAIRYHFRKVVMKSNPSNGKMAKISKKPDEISNLSDFNDEVLLRIFKYLCAYDIYNNVALVCKKFHRITTNQYLLKEISLYSPTSTYQNKKETIIKVIKQSKGLTKLVLRRYDEELASTAMESCKNLNSLSINLGFGELLSNDIMTTIANEGQSLQYFKVHAFGNGFKTMFSARQVSRLENLREFKLVGNLLFDSGDLIELAKNCKMLETLSFQVNIYIVYQPKLEFILSNELNINCHFR